MEGKKSNLKMLLSGSFLIYPFNKGEKKENLEK